MGRDFRVLLLEREGGFCRVFITPFGWMGSMMMVWPSIIPFGAGCQGVCGYRHKFVTIKKKFFAGSFC